MPLTIARPLTLSEDRRKEIGRYLNTQWKRSVDGRSQQVDGDYDRWSKAYEGVPLEETRSVPFYKASNFVVKLIRIYIDTFTARTLNMIFATKPLYVAEGMPQEQIEGFELYLNRKALYDWKHYWAAREMCFRGNKNGTVVFKQPWVERSTIDINPTSSGSFTEQKFFTFRGPDLRPIPFEDFYVYPVTCNRLEDAVIKFHRTRYVEEIARQKVDAGDWELPDDKNIEGYLRHPHDVKKDTQQGDAGVMDPYVRELVLVECYFQYSLEAGNGKQYDLVALIEESTGDLFDLYFNPYPRNVSIFHDYRPFPREDFYYGESLAQILGQSQEEASRIHNERRDNSTIASSVIFKRRSGSLLPNPSTNWYPGKVFDLDDMDDLDVITIGRNYDDMIQQEDYTFQMANKLAGSGDVMQGDISGSMGKRGIYNTGGTMALLSEGNQRQDTNIRDVREAMSSVAVAAARLQAKYDPNDPLIDTLPSSMQQPTRDALSFLAGDKSRFVRLEVKTSNAGVNSEVRKANMLSMGQVLGQYGQTVLGMAQQILGQPQMNPGLRAIINDLISMHSSMARTLIKNFDEFQLLETIPDVRAAIESALPGASRGTQNQPPQPGSELPPVSGPGAPSPGQPSGGLLEALSGLSGQSGGPGGGPTSQ